MAKQPIIAQRQLLQQASEGTVDLSFEQPTRNGGEWSCTVSLSGSDVKARETVYGVDAVQALLNAFERARRMTGSLKVGWAGADDNAGLPAHIPLKFGTKFSRKVELVVEREVERLASRLRREADKATKAAPSRLRRS